MGIVTIQWSNDNNSVADSYKIFRKDGGGSGTEIANVGYNINTYSDDVADGTYEYKIKAITSGTVISETGWSSVTVDCSSQNTPDSEYTLTPIWTGKQTNSTLFDSEGNLYSGESITGYSIDGNPLWDNDKDDHQTNFVFGVYGDYVYFYENSQGGFSVSGDATYIRKLNKYTGQEDREVRIDTGISSQIEILGQVLIEDKIYLSKDKGVKNSEIIRYDSNFTSNTWSVDASLATARFGEFMCENISDQNVLLQINDKIVKIDGFTLNIIEDILTGIPSEETFTDGMSDQYLGNYEGIFLSDNRLIRINLSNSNTIEWEVPIPNADRVFCFNILQDKNIVVVHSHGVTIYSRSDGSVIFDLIRDYANSTENDDPVGLTNYKSGGQHPLERIGVFDYKIALADDIGNIAVYDLKDFGATT